jgi:ring-1,2-phenylacetyl-CoA epoxidase subunit PaaE
MKFHSLTVRDVKKETNDSFTIQFEKPAEAFDYLPGQYLTLRVFVYGDDERRAFSLSSCPYTDDYLAVTIKAIEDGKVSNYLKNTLEAGDTVDVLPPMGKFTLQPEPHKARHHILVGGGSGITPLMAMVRSVLLEEPKSTVSLLYQNRHQDSIIFRDMLDQLQKQYPKRLNIVHVLSRPENGWDGRTGYITGEQAEELLTKAVQAINQEPVFYLCGPEAMMNDASRVIKDQLGYDEERIHREYYTAPLDSAATEAEAAEEEGGEADYEITTQSVKVHLDGEAHEFQVEPDQSILDAAIDAGLDPPYACQEGVCTTCRAVLYSGMVSMDEREGLSDEEIQDGYVLTCQSHPLTGDVELEYK